MKMKRTLKRLASMLMLAVGILAVSASATADEIVQVFGSKNLLLGICPATSVSTIALGEAPDSIVIPLTGEDRPPSLILTATLCRPQEALAPPTCTFFHDLHLRYIQAS